MDGIKLSGRPDDRIQRILDDPETYFAEARQRARELIERDLQRERQRRRLSQQEVRRAWWLAWLEGR